MLTFQQMIPIFLAPIGGRYLLSKHEQYKTWKASRNAPYYRNWRGQYVQDLWLKRVERLVIIGAIVFVVWCFYVSYHALTDPFN